MTDLRIVTSEGTDLFLEEPTVDQFAASLRGPLLRPGDDGYDAARQVWNGMIDRRPALIARCAGVADVMAAVRFARAHRLLLAVRRDGQLSTASAGPTPRLLWGLRGGGGNFGVVTSFEYQLHPVGPVLAGMVIHPISEAKEVLRVYRDFCRGCPDEMLAAAALMTSPDGAPVAVIIASHIGDLAAGERLMAPLRKFGTPLADTIAPTSYVELNTLFDAAVPYGGG